MNSFTLQKYNLEGLIQSLGLRGHTGPDALIYNIWTDDLFLIAWQRVWKYEHYL